MSEQDNRMSLRDMAAALAAGIARRNINEALGLLRDSLIMLDELDASELRRLMSELQELL